MDNPVNPLVSIVVPTFRSDKHYKIFIQSLLDQEYKNIEILIVDENSDDRSFEAMQEMTKHDFRFKYFQPIRKLGIAGSRNFGISVSKGKYIAFAEIDMELDKSWIKTLVAKMENDSSLGGVTPKAIDFFNRQIIQTAGIRVIPQTGWVECLGLGKSVNDPEFNKEYFASLGGVGSLFKADLARKVRGNDPMLVRNVEDVDFGWKLWIAGGAIKYVPEAIVYHWTAKGKKRNDVSSISQEFHLSKILRLIFVNFELQNVIKYLPQAFMITLYRIIKNAVSGNFALSLSTVKSILWQVMNIKNAWEERKYIQSIRKLSDAELMGKAYTEGSFLSIYKKVVKPSLLTSANWNN